VKPDLDRQRRSALGALAGAPLLAVAGMPAVAAAAAGTKVLRYAFEVAETGFDPVRIIDIYSRTVTAHIFDGLYDYDHLARPFLVKPVTATAVPEVSPDFRVWTVRLRPGIYFADDAAFKGQRRELTAEDYVYSFKRFFDPRWKSPAYASLSAEGLLGLEALRREALQGNPFDYDRPVEGLRALDRYTIRFRLERPRPRLVEVIASGDLFGAVAREVVEAYGDQIMAHPVGTGPFRLVEWRRSSKIVLERNPSYREETYDARPNADDAEGQAIRARFKGRKLPMIDRVEIGIINEDQPRWLAFLNRQADIIQRLPQTFVSTAVPQGQLAPNLRRDGIQLFRTANPDITVTVFNMEDPVVGGYAPEQVALRRAIGLAIDIEQEIRLFWRGQAFPAQSPLMPLTNGYDPHFRSENGEYNLARAKALLDAYGYIDRDGDGWRERPDGSPLTLMWATTPDQRARSRDELRRKDMTALGVRTQFVSAQWPENLKNARAGKFMVWSLGYSAVGPDGRTSLDRGAGVHVGSQNLARFRNPRFDELYDRIGTLPDGSARDALFFEAKRMLIAYAPYKYHVHRVLTDLAWPLLIGYRRPLFTQTWWQYVDIDLSLRAREMGA
jgi:ABC-type transport system substrate-binding protein